MYLTLKMLKSIFKNVFNNKIKMYLTKSKLKCI